MTSSAPIAIQPKAPSAIPSQGIPSQGVHSQVTQAPVSSVAPPSSQVSSQVSANTHTTPDVLRRESEKLQEQLASILGDETKSVPAAPVSKVVEISRQQNQSQAVKPAAPAKSASLSSADQDEVKIPSWLEPLARNAATHSQNELTARDEARDDRVLEFEVQDLSVPARSEEGIAGEGEPIFETHLLDGQMDLASHAPKKSGKGLLIGAIAAGLVLAVAGGTWYSRNSSGTTSQSSSTTAEAAPAPAVASEAPAANASQPAARPTEKVATPNRSNINSEPVPAAQPVSNSAQQNSQNGTPSAQLAKGVDKTVSAELSAYKKLAEPVAAPAKKPSLGEVHLSAPKATRATGAVVGEAEALALNSSGQIIPAGDAFGGSLVGGSGKQPVAPAVPLPVGGDVKAAHLVSSVPPVYPNLARAQHIQGAVLVDALVDVNGRVSSMKVVSGPVLLHQAAMDALRQWKYQAATLDGNAVPMHLTVTVQFRLQ